MLNVPSTGVLNYWDNWVQKKFPDNRNLDNRDTTIPRIEIPIIEEFLLDMEYFINLGIARITVIEVPIIEDPLYDMRSAH